MLGKITVIQNDKLALFIEMVHPVTFKLNQIVNVDIPKKNRSIPQNNYYWAYLTWVCHPQGGNLREQGYFSIDGLHLNVKEWVKETHPNQFKVADKKFSTATLSREEFSQFFDLVNQELMIEFFGVDTSPFFKDYEKFTTWQEYNEKGIDDYLKERGMPF